MGKVWRGEGMTEIAVPNSHQGACILFKPDTLRTLAAGTHKLCAGSNTKFGCLSLSASCTVLGINAESYGEDGTSMIALHQFN